jgi:hypothetical protein
MAASTRVNWCSRFPKGGTFAPAGVPADAGKGGGNNGGRVPAPPSRFSSAPDSDTVVASASHEFVAQLPGGFVGQPGDFDGGLLRSGGVEHQRRQSERSFQGASLQIDMLQAG